MISIWPNMNEGGRDFEEFASSNHLLLDYSTYDAFEREVREIRLSISAVGRRTQMRGCDQRWQHGISIHRGTDFSEDE